MPHLLAAATIRGQRLFEEIWNWCSTSEAPLHLLSTEIHTEIQTEIQTEKSKTGVTSAYIEPAIGMWQCSVSRAHR